MLEGASSFKLKISLFFIPRFHFVPVLSRFQSSSIVWHDELSDFLCTPPIFLGYGVGILVTPRCQSHLLETEEISKCCGIRIFPSPGRKENEFLRLPHAGLAPAFPVSLLCS